jgi:hypothetical protein
VDLNSITVQEDYKGPIYRPRDAGAVSGSSTTETTDFIKSQDEQFIKDLLQWQKNRNLLSRLGAYQVVMDSIRYLKSVRFCTFQKVIPYVQF